MPYIPFNYEQINLSAGTYSPSPVKEYNNKTFNYWSRSLFQRAVSTLDFTLPDDWQGSVRDFFLYCMFKFGYVVTFDPPEFGRTFQPCTLRGQNFHYQPTDFIVSNPLLNYEGKLGKDGELIKLTPDYRGVWDVIEYYSGRLSNLDVAINTGLINAQIGLVLGGKTKAAVEALKKILDKAHEGEPAVFIDKVIIDEDKAEPWQAFQHDLRQDYMITEQLQNFQSILNEFDAEIGIPTLPYQKAERMNIPEAESRQIDGTARSRTWYDTLKSSIKEVKKLYPDIKLDVKMRYDSDGIDNEEGVTENEQE